MTEPQELRSIDELFKNTFNNLPETPAESGWDIPSDRVWDHVRDNITAPRSGWSLQSLALLAGFAVILAVGLYFAFGNTEKTAAKPVETVAAPIAVPVATEAAKVEPAAVVQVQEIKPQPAHNTVHRQRQPTAEVSQPEPSPKQETQLPVNRDTPHTIGAAPLPGSNETKIPNTTEALKIEHAKQLERLWKTPLQLLPVPNINKVKE